MILTECLSVSLFSKSPTWLPSLPLQKQGVRLRGDHRTPPELFTQLPRQRPTGVVTVSGSRSSHPHADEAVVKQEVVPEQRLAAQCESLVCGDQAA